MTKKRLDTDKNELANRLVALEEDANALAFAKVTAQVELAKAQKCQVKSSSSETSKESNKVANQQKQIVLEAEKESLTNELQKEVVNLELQNSELQNKTNYLEEVLKKERSSATSNMLDTKKEIENLYQDLGRIKAQKVEGDQRLELEIMNGTNLKQTIELLQKQSDVPACAKKVTEAEQKQLNPEFNSQTNSIAEEVAPQLQQQVEALQEEKESALCQVKKLEDAISKGQFEGGEISQYSDAHVRKLHKDIEILETDVRNLTKEKRLLEDSKGKIEGEVRSIRGTGDERIEAITSQTHILKTELDVALKEANDARLAEKEERSQVQDLQTRMDELILQLATLKSSSQMRIERLQEEHQEELKVAKESSSAEVVMDLLKLRQSLEKEKADAAKVIKERDTLKQKLATLVQNWEGEKAKSGELEKVILSLHNKLKNEKDHAERDRGVWEKSLETEKAARKAAEAAVSSICIDSTNFTLLSGEKQDCDNGAVTKTHKHISRLQPNQELAETENEALSQKISQLKQELMTHEKKIDEKEKEKDEIRHLLSQANARIKEMQHNIEIDKRENEIAISQIRKEASIAEAKLTKRISVSEQSHSKRVVCQEQCIEELQEKVNTLQQDLDIENTKAKEVMELGKEKSEKFLVLEHVIMELEKKYDKTVIELEQFKQEGMSLFISEKVSYYRGAMHGLNDDVQSNINKEGNCEQAIELSGTQGEIASGKIKQELAKYENLVRKLEEEGRSFKNLLQIKDEEVCGLLTKQKTCSELISTMKQKIAIAERETKSANLKILAQQKKLSTESAEKQKIERQNAALKSSIKKSETTMGHMGEEVINLKSAMLRKEEKKKDAGKKLRQELETERGKAATAEQESRMAKDTVLKLKKKINNLETQNSDGKAKVSSDIVAASMRDLDSLVIKLQDENSRLKKTTIDLGKSATHVRSFHHEGEISVGMSQALRAEQELRLKAEEIAAALARRAKSGFEQRNAEIVDLKMKLAVQEVKLAELEDTKNEITSVEAEKITIIKMSSTSDIDAVKELQNLRPIVKNLELLYEMKDRSLQEMQVSLCFFDT